MAIIILAFECSDVCCYKRKSCELGDCFIAELVDAVFVRETECPVRALNDRTNH